ncbi:hypothetical protein BO99DRAFT_401675, partial [Aspergillus violaceofuscus CBS 115571]
MEQEEASCCKVQPPAPRHPSGWWAILILNPQGWPETVPGTRTSSARPLLIEELMSIQI